MDFNQDIHRPRHVGCEPFAAKLSEIDRGCSQRRIRRCARRGTRPYQPRSGTCRSFLQTNVFRRRSGCYPRQGEINELHVGLKGTMNAIFLKALPKRPGAVFVVELNRVGPAEDCATATKSLEPKTA